MKCLFISSWQEHKEKEGRQKYSTQTQSGHFLWLKILGNSYFKDGGISNNADSRLKLDLGQTPRQPTHPNNIQQGKHLYFAGKSKNSLCAEFEDCESKAFGLNPAETLSL